MLLRSWSPLSFRVVVLTSIASMLLELFWTLLEDPQAWRRLLSLLFFGIFTQKANKLHNDSCFKNVCCCEPGGLALLAEILFLRSLNSPKLNIVAVLWAGQLVCGSCWSIFQMPEGSCWIGLGSVSIAFSTNSFQESYSMLRYSISALIKSLRLLRNKRISKSWSRAPSVSNFTWIACRYSK